MAKKEGSHSKVESDPERLPFVCLKTAESPYFKPFCAKMKETVIYQNNRFFMVAGAGFEPCDLRVITALVSLRSTEEPSRPCCSAEQLLPSAKHNPKYNKSTKLSFGTLLVAGAGFEPYDLRVMSPMSYQTALPRDIRCACILQASIFYYTLLVLSTLFLHILKFSDRYVFTHKNGVVERLCRLLLASQNFPVPFTLLSFAVRRCAGCTKASTSFAASKRNQVFAFVVLVLFDIFFGCDADDVAENVDEIIVVAESAFQRYFV